MSQQKTVARSRACVCEHCQTPQNVEPEGLVIVHTHLFYINTAVRAKGQAVVFVCKRCRHFALVYNMGETGVSPFDFQIEVWPDAYYGAPNEDFRVPVGFFASF